MGTSSGYNQLPQGQSEFRKLCVVFKKQTANTKTGTCGHFGIKACGGNIFIVESSISSVYFSQWSFSSNYQITVYNIHMLPHIVIVSSTVSNVLWWRWQWCSPEMSMGPVMFVSELLVPWSLVFMVNTFSPSVSSVVVSSPVMSMMPAMAVVVKHLLLHDGSNSHSCRHCQASSHSNLKITQQV